MLFGIAGFLLFLTVLLALPVTVRFSVQWPEPYHGQASLRWLFSLIRIRMGAPQSESQINRKKKRVPSKKSRKKSGDFQGALAMFRQERFRRRIRKFILDFLKAIDTDDLNFSARIGLGDPADTGLLWAFIGPLAAILDGMQAAVIRIEPDFTEQTIEINSRGMIRLIPLQFLSLLLCFVLSPVTLRAIYAMYKSRRP